MIMPADVNADRLVDSVIVCLSGWDVVTDWWSVSLN